MQNFHHETEMYKFADIILPLSLSQVYTYAVPEWMSDDIAEGMRVIVPLGRQKFYTGIVQRLHNENPLYPDIKPVTTVIDDRPTLLHSQLCLWQFVADYYCTPVGDVYRAALPSALRIESEQEIILVSEMVGEGIFTSRQQNIINRLADGKAHRTSEFSVNELKSVRQLVERGVLANQEHLTDAYRPKYVTDVTLAPQYRNVKAVRTLMSEMKPAKKQCAALEAYIAASPDFAPVERAVLTKQYSIGASIIKALADKDIFRIEQRHINRIDTVPVATSPIMTLNDVQRQAADSIRRQWQRHNVVLLHGVAASGKTLIYMHLIDECIKRGGQALLLIPETGMSRRLTRSMKQYFGNAMGTYHSQCSNYERVEIYNHQLSDAPYQLVVGIRSAVFLPYKRLQLVIVDDEHDTGYKQSDPSPRYHGRDTAIYLAAIHGAKTLLGSATPSVDTYANCHFGKYGLTVLGERYGTSASKTTVELVDMVKCRRQRRLKGHFSLEMIEAIQETVAAHHQVIVFQNRRGFAPYAECADCGYVPRCPNCDVSLTAHNHTRVLTCHYCGHTEPWTEVCPKCGKPALTTHGFGTEQVEAELRLLFPGTNIARLDLDTSRSTRTYDRIFADLQSGKTDIVVGTQMVTKGIDLDNVTLVCILNADNLLYHADFRAYERAYQIMVQAIGRTGRGAEHGRVMIQTSQTANPIMQQITNGRYADMFAAQMVERHTFHYPPYYKIVKILVKHADSDVCRQAALHIANRLRLRFGDRVLGPDAPAVTRIQNKYIQQVILKIENSAPVAEAKSILMGEINAIRSVKPYNAVSCSIDVDPQ